MTPQELLRKAADDIECLGHNKYTYWLPGELQATAPACAYGAMSRVASGGTNADYCNLEIDQEWLVSQAANLLATRIADEDLAGWKLPIGSTFERVSRYNDRPETTGADVARKMREAAES